MNMPIEAFQAPNLHDYWAHPDSIEGTPELANHVRENRQLYRRALEPVADLFLSELAPSGRMDVNVPPDCNQYFGSAARAAHFILDSIVKIRTDDASYVGIVELHNRTFEKSGRMGSSLTVVCGKSSDGRPPSEYASVALNMPHDMVATDTLYDVRWLPRLPSKVIEARSTSDARAELLKNRASAAELKARSSLFDKVIAAVIERTNLAATDNWNTPATELDMAVRDALWLVSSEGRSCARDLVEVQERAATGLLPSWESLFTAAAAVMNDEELNNL